MKYMYVLSFKLPHTHVEEAMALLDQYFQNLSCFEDESAPPSDILDDNSFPISSQFIMNIFLQDPTYGDLIHAILNEAEMPIHHFNIEQIIDQDWLKLCYENFKPLTVGQFFIHSSYAPQSVPQKHIGLMIDAATAFGSGEHQTTRGCLHAIDTIIKTMTVSHVLDVGCGSGILGLAFGKACPNANIVGVDIDANAVSIAQHNAQLNEVTNFQAYVSDGLQNLESPQPYDVILANILARPLINIAPHVKAHSNNKTYVVLSGLLSRQQEDVLTAYIAQGFCLHDIVQIDDWSTLILKISQHP